MLTVTNHMSRSLSAHLSASGEVLISRIAQGDRLAMEVLFARHRVRVYRYMLGLVRNQTAAEELVSDVFFDVWRQAGRFEGRCAVLTWLLAIARFKALSWIRQRIRRRKREEPLDEDTLELMVDPSNDPEKSALIKDKSAVLRKCLESLSPKHREVIDLVYCLEQSVQEVAEILSIPEDTVKTRMFYA